MSVSNTYGISVSGGGLTIQASIVRTGSASISLSETLNAAKTGTLATRTDANTGNLTMTAGHGITTGQIIDIYWDGGVQYAVTVGTVATNDVPIDLGVGDDLPAQDTAITAVVQATANLYIDADNAGLIAIELKTLDRTLRTAGHIEFYDVDDNLIAELDLVTNIPQVYDIEGGATNPFTGAPITYLKLSQGGSSTTETYTLQIIGVYDATP